MRRLIVVASVATTLTLPVLLNADTIPVSVQQACDSQPGALGPGTVTADSSQSNLYSCNYQTSQGDNLTFLSGVGSVVVPTSPNAAPTFSSLANYGNTEFSNFYSSGSLPTFLNNAFTLVISLAAMMAVVRLVWAGYLYMGSDRWTLKKHATDVIRDVVFGLIILLAIYLILFQINPDILNLCILRNVPGASASCA